MAKHTPAPWRAGDPKHLVEAQGNAPVYAGAAIVARCPVQRLPDHPPQVERAMADAALVAEAPVMLALLRRLATPSSTEGDFRAAMTEARALLARVDGVADAEVAA